MQSCPPNPSVRTGFSQAQTFYFGRSVLQLQIAINQLPSDRNSKQQSFLPALSSVQWAVQRGSWWGRYLQSRAAAGHYSRTEPKQSPFWRFQGNRGMAQPANRTENNSYQWPIGEAKERVASTRRILRKKWASAEKGHQKMRVWRLEWRYPNPLLPS